MRICVIYDCLYPWTVGGAERWLRDLSEALARDGHTVTYLTRQQWPAELPPRIPGVTVVAVSRQEPLYGTDGNRTIGEPLRFGWGVLRHLLRHRHSYDAVHLCAFPYFSVLAAALALTGRPTRRGVDWFEVWSRHYWQQYTGRIAGLIGWLIQRACVRVGQQAFVFSNLHADRLRREGCRGPIIRLGGLYEATRRPPVESGPQQPPFVLFAGRLIPDKRVTLIPGAVAAARAHVPGLRGLILGDGPQAGALQAAITRAGMQAVIDTPGFVESAAVQDALARATCLVLPSAREGYGLVVIEAAANGTPSVVVPAEDNAAVELVEPGVNGFVATAASEKAIAEAIVAVHAAGPRLRDSTRAWFTAQQPRLSLRSSLDRVLAAYGEPTARAVNSE
jgi:glycosyltransferase involved in cell wall biosynthesis